MNLSALILPLLLSALALYGTGRRVNVYAALTHGAEEGLTVLLHIIPALVALLTAVSMLRASGAMELLSRLCAPLFELLGIPPETAPLMLIRPVSGSGALAVASELMAAPWPGQHRGPRGRRDDGQHRDHVLHHRRLFRLRRNRPHPPHRSGGAGSGLHRFSGGGMDRPPVLRPLTS